MLTLALPNGSLQQKTLDIFYAANLEIKQNGRCTHGTTNNPLIKEVCFTRPQSIPRLVASGIFDIGICGRDCLLEYGAWAAQTAYSFGTKQLVEVLQFTYSKRTFSPTKVVVVGMGNCLGSIDELCKNLYGYTVYTEYPFWTKQLIGSNARNVTIVPSPGSTEAHIPIEFPFGICMTETGNTIRENGLTIMLELFRSPVVLIAHAKKIRNSEESQQAIRIVAERLQEAYACLLQEGK